MQSGCAVLISRALFYGALMSQEALAANLARIADALDRISPPPAAQADPLAAPAYHWQAGLLAPTRDFRPLPLALLTGIDAQKDSVVANGRRLAGGHAAHDVLLWGARGTGKSALVKAMVGALQDEGAAIALVEVAADALATLPHLFALIAGAPRAFALFIDDIGFEENGAEARTLRSLLEGGAEARPANARLHVTSNRRHIVSRDLREQDSPINPRDEADDKLALADRFGLSIGFHNVNQDNYVAMVAAYARKFDLNFDAADAIRWATQRGSRSGRVAWQYVVELAGRAGKAL